MLGSKTLLTVNSLSTASASRFASVSRRQYNNQMNAYPQYSVFGENCMLSFKMLPPYFKYLDRRQTLILDTRKKGRFLIEWIPKISDGTLSRDRESIIRFGLSAEEVGLILNQLPQQQTIEMSRKPSSDESLYDGPTAPQKVCKIVPSPGLTTVDWMVDFEVDGVGGQPMQNNILGPLSVTMQTGEVQVVMEIMRSSLPSLVGWSTMQEIALRKSVSDAHSGRGDGGGPPPSDPFGF